MMQKQTRLRENDELQNYIESQLDATLSPDQSDLLRKNAPALRKVLAALTAQALIDLSSTSDPMERERIWQLQNAYQAFNIALSFYSK